MLMTEDLLANIEITPREVKALIDRGDTTMLTYILKRLLLMLPTERHVMHTVALVPGRIARAVGDADREQPMHVAMKPFGINGAVFTTTGTLHAGNRFASAGQIE